MHSVANVLSQFTSYYTHMHIVYLRVILSEHSTCVRKERKTAVLVLCRLVHTFTAITKWGHWTTKYNRTQFLVLSVWIPPCPLSKGLWCLGIIMWGGEMQVRDRKVTLITLNVRVRGRGVCGLAVRLTGGHYLLTPFLQITLSGQHGCSAWPAWKFLTRPVMKGLGHSASIRQ